MITISTTARLSLARRTIQLAALAAASVVLASNSEAARHDPPERELLEGYPMVTLLDWGDIPSIDDPVFVPSAVADGFMFDREPVIGITDADGGNPRCYSLVHLDQHEVVNDEVGETPIAVTW